MDTNRKRFLYHLTTARAGLRSSVWRHFQHMFASVFSFAKKRQDKVAPCGIRNAFGNVVVFYHVGDLQIFNNDGIISRIKLMRCFPVEVLALIDNAFVLFCEFVYKFLSSMASLIASRYDALCSFQFLFGLSQMARIRNLFALGGREKRFKANINTNSGYDFNLRDISHFNGDVSIPARGFSLNREGFYFPIRQWAMVANFDFTDFWYNKAGKPTTNTTYQRFAQMGIGHRAIATFALKTREPRLFAFLETAKEGFVGFIETTKGVLEDVDMQNRPKERFFSQGCQCRLLSAIVDSFVSLLVCFFSPSKRLILTPTPPQ